MIWRNWKQRNKRARSRVAIPRANRLDAMAEPKPLPVWDRKNERLVDEFLDDHKSTYETRPRRSPTAWLESQPIFDWMVAAIQHSGRSARKIQHFIERHNIDMSQLEPVIDR